MSVYMTHIGNIKKANTDDLRKGLPDFREANGGDNDMLVIEFNHPDFRNGEMQHILLDEIKNIYTVGAFDKCFRDGKEDIYRYLQYRTRIFFESNDGETICSHYIADKYSGEIINLQNFDWENGENCSYENTEAPIDIQKGEIKECFVIPANEGEEGTNNVDAESLYAIVVKFDDTTKRDAKLVCRIDKNKASNFNNLLNEFEIWYDERQSPELIPVGTKVDVLLYENKSVLLLCSRLCKV